MTKKLLMGNEAFAHAALEAGVRVAAGYPGTPSSELIETVAKLHASGAARGVHVEWSTNEKSALELLAGASYAGARCLFTCKQVGLNVASDPLMSLNYVGVKGGLVLFVADDPGPISSQTEQDTRRFAAFAKIPVLDPSTPDEGFAMMKEAFELSERYRTHVIVRPTTRINHASTFFDVADATDARPVPPEGFERDPTWIIFPRRAYEAHGEINERLRKCSLRAIFFSSITNPSTRFVNSLVYTGVGIVGALSVVGGGLSVGQLSAFLSYANQYTKPFNEISGVVTELQNALACAGRVFELIEEPAQSPDAPDARVLENAQGRVSIQNVAFSYRPEQPLIENFHLDVKPGQRVALVGPTGCGKTTVINLLMRFYDVDSGSIQVEGTDIRDITRHSLRRSYGMVLQDTWLKRGTIRENIAYGKPEATLEEVVEAAKAAHAHSFIKRLPQGYDTVIGEDGGSISQGQKQLLCIARVMLCLPPMLILDEATSSIDTRTEIRIQKAFQKMMQGRTSFIVAHRLSTIRDADTILVMRDGHIVEQGNHESLLQKGGFYAELYNSQFDHS